LVVFSFFEGGRRRRLKGNRTISSTCNYSVPPSPESSASFSQSLGLQIWSQRCRNSDMPTGQRRGQRS
jgi:hypothetical protein